MSFPRYPEYKKSGVEWHNSVPKHWELGPLKHFYQIIGGSTPKSDVDAYWNGSILWVTPADLSKISGFNLNDSERTITELGLNSCGTYLVPAGSIVLSTRAPIGTLGIAMQTLCTNQGCKSLIPKNNQNSKFLAYLLRVTTKALNIRGRGTTFLELSTDDLGSFQIPVPTLLEQFAIVNFLDQEITKIDSLISEQEKLIELLKEKRQAVISHAVTKGLDPNVKMKDSGVEWLGQVPEHWEILKLKYKCIIFPSNVDKHSRENESSILLCNYTDVYYNETITAELKFMQATASIEQILKFSLKAGDTIITKDSETADDIGIAAFVPNDLPGVICGYHLSMVRPKNGVSGLYIKRLFDSTYVKSRFAISANGLTRVGLGQYVIHNIEMPFPSEIEQKKIAEFLDNDCKKIDGLIRESRNMVILFKERRSALISAAVTGQIDVRNVAITQEAA